MINKDKRIAVIEVNSCFDCPYIDLTGLGYFCCYKETFKIGKINDTIETINDNCKLLKYNPNEIYMIKDIIKKKEN